ncbi:hypothetical protein pipiens_006072 [Culex pipiens pipiens]|uniref:Uncharacterized protein n=1 Tax=Culex pipiens pipiens TaxID=38569 RepID=A0ABD1DUA5_CULPP
MDVLVFFSGEGRHIFAKKAASEKEPATKEKQAVVQKSLLFRLQRKPLRKARRPDRCPKTESDNTVVTAKKGTAAAVAGSGTVATKKASDATRHQGQKASPGTTGAAAGKKKAATKDDKAIEAKVQKGAATLLKAKRTKSRSV